MKTLYFQIINSLIHQVEINFCLIRPPNKRNHISFIAVLRRITIAVSPPETKQKLLHDVNKITHKSSLFFGRGGGVIMAISVLKVPKL